MLIEKLQQNLRISGYSPKTIKAYTLCVRKIYNHFKKPLNTISSDEFKQYLDGLIRKRNSPYTVNQYHAAYKFVVTKIYQRSLSFPFPYAKRHMKLPVVLSRKDIITVIPAKLKTSLQNLMAGKMRGDYLFESERGGKLTERSAQKVFSNALKKASISKPATFHSLRHSFASHLLESGVDVRYVQELLGHTNIRTTQVYTQVTNPKIKNIKSPL